VVLNTIKQPNNHTVKKPYLYTTLSCKISILCYFRYTSLKSENMLSKRRPTFNSQHKKINKDNQKDMCQYLYGMIQIFMHLLLRKGKDTWQKAPYVSYSIDHSVVCLSDYLFFIVSLFFSYFMFDSTLSNVFSSEDICRAIHITFTSLLCTHANSYVLFTYDTIP
jgi:hypothetical protein